MKHKLDEVLILFTTEDFRRELSELSGKDIKPEELNPFLEELERISGVEFLYYEIRELCKRILKNKEIKK